MSTKEYAGKLSKALASSRLCEPVSASFGDQRVAVLCRVKRENEANWLEMITRVLIEAQNHLNESYAWKCHICRNYFLKTTDGIHKTVWGWNFSIQAKEMQEALEMIAIVIGGGSIPTSIKNEVTEFPLPGATADRNTPRKGKGVQTTGGAQDFHPLRSTE